MTSKVIILRSYSTVGEMDLALITHNIDTKIQCRIKSPLAPTFALMQDDRGGDEVGRCAAT